MVPQLVPALPPNNSQSLLVLMGTHAEKSTKSSSKDDVPRKYCSDASGFRKKQDYEYLLKESQFQHSLNMFLFSSYSIWGTIFSSQSVIQDVIHQNWCA